MSENKRTVIVVLLLSLLASAAMAGELRVELLSAKAGDLSARNLVVPPAAKAGPHVGGPNIPRDAVAVSRPFAEDIEIETPRPFTSRSKDYQVEFSAAELAAGVPVYTTAPGALVRFNPVAAGDLATKRSVDPMKLVLVAPNGKAFADGAAMENLVDAEKMAQTGLPFPAGTSAFRVREDVGAGVFQLRAEGLTDDGTRYMMHVREAASPLELTLRTARVDYLHGQRLAVEATLVAGEAKLTARRLEGFVTSPAGRAWPVEFRATRRGTYRATLKLDTVEVATPGLWEVHASADGHIGGHAFLRSGRVAFGAAVPTARLDGSAVLLDDGFGVRLGVEVATAGRYEARGVLFGTAADGTLRPMGLAQSASWLEAGTDVLELRFSDEVFDGLQLGAPYEIRDLRLLDQGRMGVLHRQDRGLVIGR